MSQLIRSWTAGLGMVVMLAAIPAAIATIQTPGVSKADVCADAGGRHVDVGGCTNVANDAAVGVAVAGSDDRRPGSGRTAAVLHPDRGAVLHAR